MIKVRHVLIGKRKVNNTIIVGLCPNRHHWQLGDGSDEALDRRSISGRIIHEAVDYCDGVCLTNLTNWTADPKRISKDMICEGIREFNMLCNYIKPCLIICLGNQIFDRLQNTYAQAKMVSIPHPSFINRFHHADAPTYVNLVRDLTCLA
jgi:hypothetical protein